MATFEDKVIALTSIAIDGTSTPTNTELSSLLVDGVIDVVNKITVLKPEELSKFTKTTHHTGSGTKKGKILSVLREHNSTDILRVCTPINPALRYEATDVDSLHYRSKFNPGYYELDGSIHCVPGAQGSNNNDIVVTQVNYDAGLLLSDTYGVGDIENFPVDYEYLVVLHASAMSCMAAASGIHASLPTKPNAPREPIFPDKSTELPDAPEYISPILDFNLASLNSNLANEDIEMSEKEMEKIDKKMEKFRVEQDNNQKLFTKELETFKSELDMRIKNSDRTTQIVVAEYKNALEKYQGDTAAYTAEMQEKVAQYKWYIEQYAALMNQYNGSIVGRPPKQAPEERRGS